MNGLSFVMRWIMQHLQPTHAVSNGHDIVVMRVETPASRRDAELRALEEYQRRIQPYVDRVIAQVQTDAALNDLANCSIDRDRLDSAGH